MKLKIGEIYLTRQQRGILKRIRKNKNNDEIIKILKLDTANNNDYIEGIRYLENQNRLSHYKYKETKK